MTAEADPRAIVVVGAGAAGLMAAAHAAPSGRPVVLVEGTPDGGRKVLISGGGRCNILPSHLEPARFVSESPPHLVRRLLAAWPLRDQRQYFELDLAIRLVQEPETGKLFPASNRAREVRDRLVTAARERGVQCRFGRRVLGVTGGEGRWEVRLDGGEVIAARAVVITTGGLSVPATGSDGFGLNLARELGHRVEPTYPALTPLLAGTAPHVALAGVTVTAILEARGGGLTATARDGFLFTHRGYSGPAVLDVSHVATRHRDGPDRARIRVQWCGVDAAAWEARLTTRSPQQVATVLREELPARLVERLLLESGVPADTQLAQLPREARRALVERLCRYELPWTSDEGYKKAEVTGGGVALGEVEPATLESRRAPGIYFAGEVLDAFGPIGGYNFAWAWVTGRSAGLAAARK